MLNREYRWGNQDEGFTGIEKIAKPGREDDSPILFRRQQGSALEFTIGRASVMITRIQVSNEDDGQRSLGTRKVAWLARHARLACQACELGYKRHHRDRSEAKHSKRSGTQGGVSVLQPHSRAASYAGAVGCGRGQAGRQAIVSRWRGDVNEMTPLASRYLWYLSIYLLTCSLPWLCSFACLLGLFESTAGSLSAFVEDQ